jgi:hypothetical protein
MVTAWLHRAGCLTGFLPFARENFQAKGNSNEASLIWISPISMNSLACAVKCYEAGMLYVEQGTEWPELDGNDDTTVNIWDGFSVSN